MGEQFTENQAIYMRGGNTFKQGMIVYLNGTSSSGKTSISKELKNQSEIPFHHLSIDVFCNGMFLGYIDFINKLYPDLEPTSEEDGHKVAQIITEPLISLYYSTIKNFSALGMNVIVDTVIDQDEWFNTCVDLLADHPVLFVGVTCSKEELVRREQLRGDRNIGLAISQYDKVYCFSEYDIEINTETLKPNECASKITNFISSGQEGSAFRKLNKRTVSVI